MGAPVRKLTAAELDKVGEVHLAYKPKGGMKMTEERLHQCVSTLTCNLQTLDGARGAAIKATAKQLSIGNNLVGHIAAAVEGGTEKVDAFVAGYMKEQGIKAKKSRRGKNGTLLDSEQLKDLDLLIQTELAQEERRITAAAVKELAARELGVVISISTAKAALHTLKYSFNKLKRKYKFTSKRKYIIENFMVACSRVLHEEEAGDTIRVWHDESHAYQGMAPYPPAPLGGGTARKA